MTKSWTKIDISCGTEVADDLAAELGDRFGATVEFTAGGIRIYFDSSTAEKDLPELDGILRSLSKARPESGPFEWKSSEIPDEDWSENWKAHFKPFRVGRRLIVAPTWEPVNPGPEDLVIWIDPGRAFGTGHHETTRLCLEWLESWADRVSKSTGQSPGSLLDAGTGSGILAIGGALLGFDRIIGIDNDPEAVEVAVPNVELNKLSGKIRIFCSSPDEVSDSFDVLISNIQSLPLIRMSETLVSKVKPGGRLALSGILAEQAEDVCAAFTRCGAVYVDSDSAGEWVLLEFEVPGGVANG